MKYLLELVPNRQNRRGCKAKMSVGHRREAGEKIFAKRAETSIYKIKKVSRDYQVPYLAGYSKDKSTIYIDTNAAKGYADKNGFVSVDKYWCIHEFVEDSCLENGADYNLGHALATLAEEQAVIDDGFDVDKYNAFCRKEIKRAGSRAEYDNLPSDLDMQPYLQDGQDRALLKKMGYL